MNRLSPKRILWLSFGPIGDTLMMLALFDDILRIDRGVKITVLSSANVSIIKDLAGAYPQVDIRKIPSSPFRMIPFFWDVFKTPAVLLVPGVARMYSRQVRFFCTLMKIRPGNVVVGFKDTSKNTRMPFDHVLLINFDLSILDNYRRMVEYVFPGNSGVVKMIGQPVNVRLPKLPGPTLPFSAKKYFVIHMCGTRARYSLPPQRWEDVITKLHAQYPDYGLVFTGAGKDRAFIDDVVKKIPEVFMCIDDPILEVAAIIADSVLYIGVDTGITHLAGVQNHPSVILYHNTDKPWHPGYNKKAIVLSETRRCLCNGRRGGDCVVEDNGINYRRCIYDISDEMILDAVHRQLNS